MTSKEQPFNVFTPGERTARSFATVEEALENAKARVSREGRREVFITKLIFTVQPAVDIIVERV